jgi:histidine triad (HIT) family protein
VFCAIVRGDAPASVVTRNDVAMAFMDIRPVTPGHTLVVSLRHAQHLSELSDDEWLAVASLSKTVQRALRSSGVRCEALNLYVADGVAAGQEVPHVHVHIIPRYPGDGFGLKFPPGYGFVADRASLDAVAVAIRDQL